MGVASESQESKTMSSIILSTSSRAPRLYSMTTFLLTLGWAVACIGLSWLCRGWFPQGERLLWAWVAVVLWALLPMLVFFTSILTGLIPGRSSLAVAMLLYLALLTMTLASTMVAVDVVEPGRATRISKGFVKVVKRNISLWLSQGSPP